jgi:signal transduction histidine kinase
VREVIEELRAAHRGRDIRLEADGDLRGEWDPGRMAQLFTNLTANALTHGEKQSPVWIRLTADESDVVLQVSNRSAKILPSHPEQLFEPFRQGDDATRRGLGLGLFIVREIVKAHGGSVGVASEDSLVRFTARLPRESSTPSVLRD